MIVRIEKVPINSKYTSVISSGQEHYAMVAFHYRTLPRLLQVARHVAKFSQYRSVCNKQHHVDVMCLVDSSM